MIMRLNAIKLLDFRNYKRLELEQFGDTNVLIGKNGSGKTNFLEAVFMLSQVHSLRGVSLPDLITWNETSFYICGMIEENKIEIGYSPQKKVIKLNNNPAEINDLISRHPIVAYLPEDMEMITGNPDSRRAFIDQALSALDSEYWFSLHRYQRAVKQKNAQLKISFPESRIWNEELVKYGSKIIEKRLKLIQKINPVVRNFYTELYEDEIELKYLNTFKIERSISDSFQLALEKSAPMEQIKRHTLIGPHRDNFEIRMTSKEVKSFASQGQKRALALVLKWSLLEERRNLTGIQPILLLDDVLLELDQGRRTKFLEKIVPHYQTFFTATSMELLKMVREKVQLYEINQGTINKLE
jgi:DNA replication and repair protein RecF